MTGGPSDWYWQINSHFPASLQQAPVTARHGHAGSFEFIQQQLEGMQGNERIVRIMMYWFSVTLSLDVRLAS